ncbi:hypothetical protein NMY22_g973 [Coprinellus aureogranulatus]|nr:hypothetical protein NMY22_g973 [Coprinellus aureogranulatus]
MNRVYTNVHSDDPFRLPVPRRVLVVGGGPAGLVTLRNLVERGTFDTVQLVERRDDVGGVWYLEGDPRSEDRKPRWPSAAYKGLVGNVLPEFLSFSGNPFPRPATTEEGQPFANIGETFAYLKAFASPYLQSGQIRLNTEVVTVEERPWGEGWKVSMRDWSDEGKEIEEIWDAVVVAVHWHDNAEWPSTPGLGELRQLGLAKHAKVWRGPQGYESSDDVAVLVCLDAFSMIFPSTIFHALLHCAPVCSRTTYVHAAHQGKEEGQLDAVYETARPRLAETTSSPTTDSGLTTDYGGA